MSYKNPTPVVVCLIQVDGPDATELLGIVRGIEPYGLALVGGYVDEMETPEMAATRETREETGLEVDPSAWKHVAYRIAPGNKLLCFVTARAGIASADVLSLKPTPEALGFTLINADTELVFSIHQEVARKFLSELAGPSGDR